MEQTKTTGRWSLAQPDEFCFNDQEKVAVIHTMDVTVSNHNETLHTPAYLYFPQNAFYFT